MFLHGIYDFGWCMVEECSEDDNLLTVGVLLTAVAVIANIVLLFFTIRSVRRAPDPSLL